MKEPVYASSVLFMLSLDYVFGSVFCTCICLLMFVCLSFLSMPFVVNIPLCFIHKSSRPFLINRLIALEVHKAGLSVVPSALQALRI